MRRSPFVDAHCHFDLFPDPHRILQEAEAGQIYSLAVTNTPSVFEPMRRLTEGLTYVEPALGLHPELALQRASELPLFAQLVPTTPYVGEIGLDYTAAVTPSERSEQRAIYATLLRHCAEAGGKILSAHSRRAEADVVAAIDEYRPGPFILHWYSGPLRVLRAAVASGGYFSINAAMARSGRGLRILEEIPRERVLTESDGPFVKVGQRVASPQSVAAVVERLARVWRVESSEAAEQVFRNFRSILESNETPSRSDTMTTRRWTDPRDATEWEIEAVPMMEKMEPGEPVPMIGETNYTLWFVSPENRYRRVVDPTVGSRLEGLSDEEVADQLDRARGPRPFA